EELRELAQRAAAKVRERGRPWHLEPMAPHERRIVHLALADDPEIETESVGEGYLKRVRIKPAQDQPVPQQG
ncbi:MAG: R3H domain-containing nucleic acid-binding protein, partial [Thermoanaerobaculia bacterium]